MQFRPDYKAVIARTKAFYAMPRRGAALVQVLGGEGISLQSSKPLEKWRLPGEMIPYIDDRVAAVARFWECRQGLDDDLIPAIAPWYGIAEHTAFLGGEVEFTGGTSFNHQILSDWKDFDHLKLDENHPWLRMVVDGIRHCREKWGTLFAAKLRGADASHAWVSVWLPGHGWIDIDPTNNTLVDDGYVVLGWGRDYHDVPPLRGVVFTPGQGSTLEVAVDLVPEGTDPYL